ncbi:MAG: type II toxin-antitoxin system VapB family antitoxin [Solirubrobacteraceae bacterium]
MGAQAPLLPRCTRRSSQGVRGTNINLDMDLVDQASAELGTARTTDTVHEALRVVVARARRSRLAQRDFADLTPDAVEEMRRPAGRTP